MYFMVTMLTALLCPHATSFLRNNVALRRRRNFGQKRLKMPKKAPKQPILLGIAEHSECVSASNGAIAYSCYKIGRACQPDLCSYLLYFFANRPKFALFGSVGVLGRFSSSIGTQGVLVAYTGIFTAEKKKA